MKTSTITTIALVAFCTVLNFSCSESDSGSNPSTGSFSYTVSGAADETISGTETNFGKGTGASTFITLSNGTDVLTITLFMDPPATGPYPVNAKVIKDQNDQIIVIPEEEGDSWADLTIGSALSGGARSFSTNSGIGGLVTITSTDENTLVGTFNFGMLELIGGSDPFNNPSINAQGQFTAVKN